MLEFLKTLYPDENFIVWLKTMLLCSLACVGASQGYIYFFEKPFLAVSLAFIFTFLTFLFMGVDEYIAEFRKQYLERENTEPTYNMEIGALVFGIFIEVVLQMIDILFFTTLYHHVFEAFIWVGNL